MSNFLSGVRRVCRGDRHPSRVQPASVQPRSIRRQFSRRPKVTGAWRSPLQVGLWAIAIALLIIAVNSLGFASGAKAQLPIDDEPIATAPIVVDGQQLFVLTEKDSESAQERASRINAQLEAWINAGVAPELSVDPNKSDILFLDNNASAQDGNESGDLNQAAATESDGSGNSTTEEAAKEDKSLLLTVTKTDALVAGQELPTARQANVWRRILGDALNKALEERTPIFLRQAMFTTLAVLLVVVVLYWWMRRLKQQILPHPLHELQLFLSSQQASPEESQPSLTSILMSLGLSIVQVGLWIVAGLYVINLFPLTRDRSYEVFRAFMDSLFSPILPLGDDTYSITDLIVLMAVFSGVILGSTVVANLLRTRILRMAGLSSGSQEAIAAITRYVLIAIGTIVVLQVWGLDLSSLTLLASALGVGIGFGFQNIAKDFGSGLVLLFERPVQVGDFVQVDEFMGTVDRIGARSTSIKTLDQVSIIVPNSYFLENQVINWSHENPLSRIALPVGVSYNADPEQVRKILLQAAEEHTGIVRLPHPQIFFNGFGDSALDFILMFWIVEPNRQLIIKSDLYFKIFALFRQNNIEIPFPQRDLHIRSGQLPVEVNHASPASPTTPSNGVDGNSKN